MSLTTLCYLNHHPLPTPPPAIKATVMARGVQSIFELPSSFPYYLHAGQDNEYVMKTRSGLTIKTVPSTRRSNSRTTVQQSNAVMNDPKLSRALQTNDTKSVSCLSFVTRYNLMTHGTKLEISNGHKTDYFDSLQNDSDIVQEGTDSVSLRAQLIGFQWDSEEIRHNTWQNVVKSEGSRKHTCIIPTDTISNNGSEIKDDRKGKNSPSKMHLPTAKLSNSAVMVENIALRGKQEIGTSNIQPGYSDPENKFNVAFTHTSYPQQPFKLGDQHVVQAQMLDGRCLMYNNIPVMVVNRIPKNQLPEKKNTSLTPKARLYAV